MRSTWLLLGMLPLALAPACTGLDASDDGLSDEANPGGKADDVSPPSSDYTVAEVDALLRELETARYDHDRLMGWAHIENNCFTRMRAVYYYFNFGELPQYGATSEDEGAQRAMMEDIQALEHSTVREVAFSVAGTIRLSGSYTSDDPEVARAVQSASYDQVSWSNHHAALVSTDEGDRVVDLAVSRRALTVEEWERTFLPAELQGRCAHDDAAAESAILDYNIMKQFHQNPPVPDPPCAFAVLPIFRADDGSQLDEGTLFPYMWNDVHDMETSTGAVRTLATSYFMANPGKVPLVRVVPGTSTHRP